MFTIFEAQIKRIMVDQTSQRSFAFTISNLTRRKYRNVENSLNGGKGCLKKLTKTAESKIVRNLSDDFMFLAVDNNHREEVIIECTFLLVFGLQKKIPLRAPP